MCEVDRVIWCADFGSLGRIEDLGHEAKDSLLGLDSGSAAGTERWRWLHAGQVHRWWWWHLLAGIRVEPPVIVGGRR